MYLLRGTNVVMKVTLSSLFQLLLLFQATVPAVLSSSFIPLSLGPDFQIPFSDDDILRGFKVNIADGENPLKQRAFEGTVRAIPFVTSYTKSQVIKSEAELADMMEISGSLGVSYGPLISGEGSGKFVKNKVVTNRQTSVLYRTRRVAYAKAVDISTITAVDDMALMSGDEIAEVYGTKFITQMVYGAQLDVIFTVTASENIDIQEIEAELEGRIGVGPLKIEFEAKFHKQTGESRSALELSIVAQASGVDFPTPANPSFDQVNDLIKFQV
jgi:hypothetical protein